MADEDPESVPLLFTCTHGADEPERATVPFIAASTAAVSGQQAIVVCTIEAVRIGTPGYAETVTDDDLTPLATLIQLLVGNGGEIWLCSSCTKKRDIGEDDLIEGARIVGAAKIVEALAEGKAISLT
ncbi:MAG: DsrE family protein [Nitriliruptorales bacterium]|nr:DsrE family protein [Nitriliruptorales bacterium]